MQSHNNFLCLLFTKCHIELTWLIIKRLFLQLIHLFMYLFIYFWKFDDLQCFHFIYLCWTLKWFRHETKAKYENLCKSLREVFLKSMNSLHKRSYLWYLTLSAIQSAHFIIMHVHTLSSSQSLLIIIFYCCSDDVTFFNKCFWCDLFAIYGRWKYLKFVNSLSQ